MMLAWSIHHGQRHAFPQVLTQVRNTLLKLFSPDDPGMLLERLMVRVTTLVAFSTFSNLSVSVPQRRALFVLSSSRRPVEEIAIRHFEAGVKRPLA
jgi:hypothetical protein